MSDGLLPHQMNRVVPRVRFVGVKYRRFDGEEWMVRWKGKLSDRERKHRRMIIDNIPLATTLEYEDIDKMDDDAWDYMDQVYRREMFS